MSVTEAEAAVEAARVALASATAARADAERLLGVAFGAEQKAQRAMGDAAAALFEARVRELPAPDGMAPVVVIGSGQWARAIAVDTIVSETIFEGWQTAPFRSDRPTDAPHWHSRQRFSTSARYSRRDLFNWIQRARQILAERAAGSAS